MSTQTHWCNLLKTPEIKSKESNQNESKSTIQLHIEHIRGLNICIVLLIWHCSHARFKYSCSSRKVYGGEDNLSIFISFSVCLCLSIALSLFQINRIAWIIHELSIISAHYTPPVIFCASVTHPYLHTYIFFHHLVHSLTYHLQSVHSI